MNFTDSMNWVEREHTFPKDTAQFHNRRFDALLTESGLREQLRSIPGVVGAGSCGKASTLSFLARILSALGLRCAVGVKPPLNESPRGNLERYQIWDEGAGDKRMSEEEFLELFPRLREAVSAVEDEHGEWGKSAPYDMRAWLLEAFAVSQKADVLVSEANIGRRRDPIGCLPNTVLTMITPIGTDHGGLLTAPPNFHPELGAKAGPFYDKAADLRLGKAACFGRQDELILGLIDDQSVWTGRDYRAVDCACTMAGSSFRLRLGEDLARYLRIEAEELERQVFSLSALGLFQCDNAAQALVGALLLRRRAQDLASAEEAEPLLPYRSSRLVSRLCRPSLEEFLAAAARGLHRATVPGRLQLWERDCVAAVAASPEKLGALLDSLRTIVPSGQRVWVCATFLDRIHRLREAVELLANWPSLGGLVVSKYLDDEVNRDADPTNLKEFCPDLLTMEPPSQAVAYTLEQARRDGDVALLLGNGMLSYLSSQRM